MTLCVALLSPGDMGHQIAKVLIKHNVNVITCLAGRSGRTAALAEAAGIRVVPDDVTLVREASMVLSILVPSKAGEIVERILVASRGLEKKPLFVDLNAIAPETVLEFAVKLNTEGIDLVDGGICGGPPKGDYNPRIYLSGKRAAEVAALGNHGLDIRVLGNQIGQASGFKIAYASVNKGLIAIGIQAFTAAREIGVDQQFAKEMMETQPELYSKISRGIPSMCPKAYRWVGEMEEIAKTFASFGMSGQLFEGAADVFRLVTSSPLGSEIVEERKLGTNLDDAVQSIIDFKNQK